MQVRNDVADAGISLFERAQKCHEELVTYGVCARDVPAAILQTQELYRAAIIQDQQHFNPEVMSEPYDNEEEILQMKVLLNKFANYHLHEHDVKALQGLNFAEADHLRAYLQFEHQALDYVRFIRDFLLKLKVDISVKAGNGHEEKAVTPAFYKHGEAPNGVKKIQHVLSNIEQENVPVNILKIYAKVCDVLDGIKPSKTRPSTTEAFYQHHCHETKMFSFIPPAVEGLGDSEEDVSSLSASL